MGLGFKVPCVVDTLVVKYLLYLGTLEGQSNLLYEYMDPSGYLALPLVHEPQHRCSRHQNNYSSKLAGNTPAFFLERERDPSAQVVHAGCCCARRIEEEPRTVVSGFYGCMLHPPSSIRQPIRDGSAPDHLIVMTASMHTARRYGGKESDTRPMAV